MDIAELNFAASLAISLVIGLLVGSERGWHTRQQDEGTRVAGIRTFTLIALLGGISALLSKQLLPEQSLLICALIFLPMSLLLIAGYLRAAQARDHLSITTEIAAMITFWLGALPAYGLALAALGTAVILSLLLHLKGRLHHWLRIIDERELLGTLQFLIVSLVLLPLLPNRGFGPWQAVNPYELWWMVVLISGLSLVGYFAVRMAGARKGILATSLAGGLVSSTSVTLNLSHLHNELPDTRGVTGGILLAWATMFARIVIVIAVISPTLAVKILPAMVAGFLGLAALAYWQLHRVTSDVSAQPPAARNPFQLLPALQFGALLGAVMISARALQHWLGESGLYLLSVITGIADVDAIVLSLANKAGEELAWSVVVTCVTLAAATNTLLKGIYCRFIAGAEPGNRVLGCAIAVTLLVTLYPLLIWFGVISID